VWKRALRRRRSQAREVHSGPRSMLVTRAPRVPPERVVLVVPAAQVARRVERVAAQAWRVPQAPLARPVLPVSMLALTRAEARHGRACPVGARP
jgi:hypothetical protein